MAVVIFGAAAVLLLRDLAHRDPYLGGDVWEHWCIAESFDRHGSPDLHPEDVEKVRTEASRHGYHIAVLPYAYATAPDGRMYGVHFWGYAACGVPAKAYLRWAGRSELGWPGLSNAMWFLLAAGVVLFGSSAPLGQRLSLLGLAAAGPAWKYIGWPGPELFSWAFMLISVVTYLDRRYVWSGVAVGLASLQNPPVILFGAVVVLAAAHERRWRSAAGAAAGAAIGLLPYAFFLYHFGKPNLIAADYARLEYVSWVRAWSQLADLNQGLLPYAPLLVLGLVFGAARLAYTRDARGLLLLAGTILVAVGTQVSRNWNSSCDGLQRYLVWMIPLAAGVAIDGIGGRHRLWAFAAAAVVLHTALIPIYHHTKALHQGYLGHTAMAEWVLTNCPRAYWAEPEVFAERTRHVDDWPRTGSEYPLGFVRADGTVSKMLLDPRSVEKVAARYEVDPDYLTALRAEASGKSGLFYAHPPRGAVRVRPPPP